jgi:hypothetical protein
MKNFIVGIAPQESFPTDDLTDDNTAILELLLQNANLRNESHDIIEATVFLYPAAHMGVKALASYVNKEHLYKGMDLGAVIYEATSSLIKPQPEIYDALSSLKAVRSISHPYIKADDFLSTIIDAKDTMQAECPNLSHVITEVSKRYSYQLTEAAIAGAGIMRSSELVAKRYFTS